MSDQELTKCPNCHAYYVEEGELCDNCSPQKTTRKKKAEDEDEN